jgi:cell division protein FtsQ
VAYFGDQFVNRYGHATRSSNYLASRGFSSATLTIVLLFVLAAAGAAWVSMGIVAKERWPIRWLEVSGSFHRVSAEQLRGSLLPLVSSSFFTVDLGGLHQVATRNSWIAEVTIQKKWPDTVLVNVLEHVPVAHWNSGQMISSQEKAFTATGADEIQGLPWLIGPDERLEEVLEHWSRFNTMLDTAGLEIARLSLDQRGSWSMQLSAGTHLYLGREEAVARLERLMSGWESLLNKHTLPPLSVDLRYTNGFAVNWPKESTEFARNNN